MPIENRTAITDLFYLVGNLLSEELSLSTIPHDMSVEDAVGIMEEYGYSQMPVNVWTETIGIFSYRSFCKAILEMEEDGAMGESILDMPVADFIEQFRFVNADENWESILPHINKDNGVLVGNSTSLDGILTAMDVVSFLQKLTKPFVMIAEIELSIRQIINSCVTTDELHVCVQNSLSQQYPADKLPLSVGSMTFNDYVQVIGDGRNWTHFESFFGGKDGRIRNPTRRTLKRIGELRNDLFHFKRTLEDDDLHYLSNKRSWLQRRAKIYEGQRRRLENEQ
jgi:CBS domain-containing protein